MTLPRWLNRLLPPVSHTRPGEWSRAALGVALGTLFSVWVCSKFFGPQVALHFIGPLGASAVLLFAVSSGALSQPWSVVGSYLCASVMSLLVVHFLGRTLDSACLAVGLSVLMMCLSRCLHPPGGALALAVVFADPTSIELGWRVLEPLMLSAACLVFSAIIYNRLTLARAAAIPAPPPAIVNPAPQPLTITAADLQQALDDMDAFIDVTPEELERLIHASEAHARRRSIGEVFADQG